MEKGIERTGAPSGAELELINSYSRKELKAEEVYTFSVVLCDNDTDRDNEHFSDDALDKLAELYVGVTGIYDHNPTAKNQVARIYDCRSETIDGKLTAYGAPYKRVVAKAYVPVCSGNEELITMLDSGIKKEVSVGCAIGKCECSICGEDMRTGACSHVKGRMYDGKMCCAVLKEPTDAYEWSFTAVPAQRNAGVIKSFSYSGDLSESVEGVNLDEKSVSALKSYIETLKASAAEGERYKSMLRLDAVKAGITAQSGISGALLEKMVKNLSADELLELKECFEKKAETLLPVRMQTAPDKSFGEAVTRDSMRQFMI